MADPYEDAVRSLFAERFGLQLCKIQESTSKTPDFEVHVDGQLVAVLEVKTLMPTDIEDATSTTPDLLRGLSDDKLASRISTRIRDAAKQLRPFHAPKILVFLNTDILFADAHDLREALQGFLRYDDGVAVQTISGPELARIAAVRASIDVYIWIDYEPDSAPELHVLPFTAEGQRLRAAHLAPPAPAAG